VAEKPSVIRSPAAFDQVNTAWNMTKSRVSRIASPATGCSSTASTLPVKVSGRSGARTWALRMRCASRCASRISPASGSRQVLSPLSAPASIRASTWATRSSMPRLRVATVVTIGQPIARARPSRSMRRPWRWAMSYMLSASTIGRPTALSSRISRSTRRRLVASATQTRTSGGVSPASRPSTASRVTTSSGLRARRE
jgi:hypothetical protein